MTTIGKAMAGGGGARTRRSNDFYPTSGPTTRSILPLLRNLFPQHVWECACGDGSMSRQLITAGFDVTSTDLVPRGYGETTDFLKTTKVLAPAIITNPPFNLADEFLQHAQTILGIEDIAFILPISFWSARGRVGSFHSFPPSFVMPMTWRMDCTGEGRPTMNFMWCVWSQAAPANPWTRFLPIVSNEPNPGRLDPLD